MASYLTSKCAGLLSNIPRKQTALWTADINLSQRCEKVLGLWVARSREERKRGQISQLEFSFVLTSKTFSGPHKHVHLVLVRFRFVSRIQTCLHWTFFLSWSAYPRWSVLYASAGHLLLVNDVHQFNGIISLHINHRPLQRILRHLVELKESKKKKKTHQTEYKTKPNRFCIFGLFQMQNSWLKTAFVWVLKTDKSLQLKC